MTRRRRSRRAAAPRPTRAFLKPSAPPSPSTRRCRTRRRSRPVFIAARAIESAGGHVASARVDTWDASGQLKPTSESDTAFQSGFNEVLCAPALLAQSIRVFIGCYPAPCSPVGCSQARVFALESGGRGRYCISRLVTTAALFWFYGRGSDPARRKFQFGIQISLTN